MVEGVHFLVDEVVVVYACMCNITAILCDFGFGSDFLQQVDLILAEGIDLPAEGSRFETVV